MAIVPKKEQLAFLDWEVGTFFHFGIRTFYEGHRDWDMKEMPLSGFNPTALNCEQWVRVSKEAGAKYCILVCKHHDGFANWPSKYTDYSVAGTPWKGGKGDVVREFTDACRRHDMKVGLYYSPAEFGSKDKQKKDYDEYFINQVSELLSGYGKIDYLWFDGCGSEDHAYDTARIIAKIRALQPEILVFNMWDPDTRWVGNEVGFAHLDNPLVVDALSFSISTEVKEVLKEARFLPVECDFRMRFANWFYSDQDEDTIKSLEELTAIYDYSVGRGANMLINIGPDRRGLLPEADANRLLELGAEIRRRFQSPLQAETAFADGRYTCQLQSPTLVDHVVLSERLPAEDYVKSFEIRCHPMMHGLPITVYRGGTVGHKAICRFPAFYTRKLEILPLGGDAGALSAQLYHAGE